MTASPLGLRGVVLPQDEPVDWVIVDGRVASGPSAVAHGRLEGWILPGLVDLHCHVGLSKAGAVDHETAERQITTDRDAGVLLIRDAGSPADTRWVDGRDDLPRLIRAGRHIARTRRYLRYYGVEIEPDQLAGEVAVQAARADGWVKLVGDWIDRATGDLEPCWPAWAVRQAIDVAHAGGARVTAHVFGAEAIPPLVDAGIDCIEHATGLIRLDDSAVMATMAARGVPIVPTLINIANFPAIAAAGEDKFPRYAAHMRALQAGAQRNVVDAAEAGVPVLAGTDAGGSLAHGLIAQEVLALVAAGLPAPAAVAAASWDARSFLLGGDGRLRLGDVADLVVLDADPRVEPAALLHPRHIVLRGRLIR